MTTGSGRRLAHCGPDGLVHFEPYGGLGVVRLDRPKVNALSAELLGQLAGLLHRLAAAPPPALVVWGGDRRFSAGVDIAELANEATAPIVLDRFAAVLNALARFPRVTVAAVGGFALGGGLELALATGPRA